MSNSINTSMFAPRAFTIGLSLWVIGFLSAQVWMHWVAGGIVLLGMVVFLIQESSSDAK